MSMLDIMVLRRNLQKTPILVELGPVAVRLPTVVVAVEMWKPTFVRVSKHREKSESPVWDSPRLARRAISTANLRILPIFGEKLRLGTPREQEVPFQKGA